MTSEIEEIMELFKITEEQAIMMLEKGFKLTSFHSSVERYVNTKVKAVTDRYKNTIDDIVSNELSTD